MRKLARLLFLYSLGALASASAATFEWRFMDDPGEGFFDTTPIPDSQRGNNPGTTFGEARRLLLMEAGRIWGARLVSEVPIIVQVSFNTQTCDAMMGTLASARPARTFFAEFDDRFPDDFFFASALADSLAGEDLMLQTDTPNDPDIESTFNLSLDTDPNCLGGAGFYYGFDNRPPIVNGRQRIDALVVALHELAHGFGFTSEISLNTGNSPFGTGFSTFVRQIFDENLGRTWPMLTAAERMASAVGNAGLAWNGSNVNNNFVALAPGVTSQRRLRLFSPTPVSPGSSVSHWAREATPNLLMEPNISRDLTRSVDVTVCALRDIGWQTTQCPDGAVGGGGAAPVANSQTLTILEDTPVQITLTGSDAENAPLTFSIITQPFRGSLGSNSFGTPTTSGRGYTPTMNANGVDSFTFNVSDGGNISAPATVLINITPVNDPPTATSPNATAIAGQLISIPLGGFDVDNDPITFELVSPPANGTASLTPGGVLTYQANARFSGPDPFTYRVRDASTTSSNVTVIIDVTPSSAPVPGGRGGGGGAMNELLLLALGLLALSARIYKRRAASPQGSH